MAMLGSMLSGLLLNSVSKFHVHSQLGDFLRTFGLTTILLMSGLEIDVET
jgi:Kef-type K+ transport system membrane component KefB